MTEGAAKTTISILYIITLVFLSSPLLLAQELIVKNEQFLNLALDVYISNMVSQYEIELQAEPSGHRWLHCTIGHPFWNITPTIEIDPHVIKNYEITCRKEDSISLSYEFIEPSSQSDIFSKITFEENRNLLLDSLQFPFFTVELDRSVPVRHHPPAYPLLLKNIAFSDGDNTIKVDDIHTSFLLRAHSGNFNYQMNTPADCSGGILRIIDINHIPLNDHPYLTFNVEDSQAGSFEALFVIIKDSDVYNDTTAVFEIRCGDKTYISRRVSFETRDIILQFDEKSCVPGWRAFK